MKKLTRMILIILFAVGLSAQSNERTAQLKPKQSLNHMKETNAYVHFHGAPSKGKILMVANSPTVSKQTGWPIGF